jgi:hypothetical protein
VARTTISAEIWPSEFSRVKPPSDTGSREVTSTDAHPREFAADGQAGLTGADDHHLGAVRHGRGV